MDKNNFFFLKLLHPKIIAVWNFIKTICIYATIFLRELILFKSMYKYIQAYTIHGKCNYVCHFIENNGNN